MKNKIVIKTSVNAGFSDKIMESFSLGSFNLPVATMYGYIEDSFSDTCLAIGEARVGGWKHRVRAALSNLKKSGRVINRNGLWSKTNF